LSPKRNPASQGRGYKPNDCISNRDQALDYLKEDLFSLGPSFYYRFYYPSFDVLEVSDTVFQAVGIYPDEYSSQYFFDQIHPSDRRNLVALKKTITDFYFNILSPKEITSYKATFSLRKKSINNKYFNHHHQAIVLANDSKASKAEVLIMETKFDYLKTLVDQTVSFIHLKGSEHYLNINILDPVFHNPVSHKFNLSKREIDIIREISRGKTSKQIANEYHISPHTVRTHRRNILKKTQAVNISSLIVDLIKQDLI